MLTEKIKKLLMAREFVYVATANPDGKPNAAPKFLVKVEQNFIYLIDYVSGKTWENIKVNPRASISFIDNETLTGYQVNGPVDLISSGPEFNEIIDEVQEKQLSLTVERIVKGVQRGKKHSNFEVALPENGVVLKMKMEEIVEISPTGKLQREKT